MRLNFPEDFFWGSSTSSHQVEGDCYLNDWWDWEKQGKVKDLSNKTCQFWNNYKKDIDLAKKLGHNSFRFSLEWSKIEPKKGVFDHAIVEHYQKIVSYCRENQMEVFLTLHHFTNPLWFSKIGGWEKRENVNYFLEYVSYVVSNIHELRYIITINEPCVYTSSGYIRGNWPPGKQNIFLAITVYKNMINAHNRAFEIIKSKDENYQVGIAKNNSYFSPYKKNFINNLAVSGARYFWNNYFLNNIKDHSDFIGLNYYFHNRLRTSFKYPFVFTENENKVTTDLGWEYYPTGIYKVLLELKKYNLPIIITENGLADAKDKLRQKFIKEHLKNVHRAIREGADVRGYLHWSLLDNFEWAEGFAPRFGLIEVNYETQKMVIRDSALYYRKIIEDNGLEI